MFVSIVLFLQHLLYSDAEHLPRGGAYNSHASWRWGHTSGSNSFLLFS